MANGENSRAINHHINEFLSKGPTKLKLDESLCLSFAQDLKRHVLGKDKQEKVNSIVVLAKLLDISPPSDGLLAVFDETLFNSLYSVVSISMSNETFKSILKISGVYLTGAVTVSRGPKTFEPLIAAVCKNLQLFDVVTNKLYTQDVRISALSLDFASKLSMRALEQNLDDIVTIVIRLREVGFSTAISTITEDKSFESEIATNLDDLAKAFKSTYTYLSSVKFDTNVNSHKLLWKELLSTLERSLNDSSKTPTPQEYARAGLTESPSTFILSDFSILDAIDFLVFLKDPNMSFRKSFYEQLMFASDKSIFPVCRSALATSAILSDVFNSGNYPNLQDHILHYDLLYYHSIYNTLKIWQASKAEDGDFETILKLVIFLYGYLDSHIDSNTFVEDVLDSIGNLSYEQLRKLQFDKLQQDHYSQWSVESGKFDKLLNEEVFEFVREQRVLQLLKGSWVYSENPVEANNNNRKPKMYFIVLSPNRQSVIYKEYKFKTSNTPNLDAKDGSIIDLSLIIDFEATKIRQDTGVPTHSRLINIVSRASFEKLVLVGKNKPLFTFYTDTKEASYVWLDGLKMLNNNSSLSSDTLDQLKMLIDIRKNVQLLSLNKNNNEAPVDVSEDASIYNINTLNSLATNFYYK